MIGKVTQLIRAASQITAGAQRVTGGIENIANGNDPDISQMVSGVNQAINGSKSAIDGLSDIIWKPTTQTSLLVQELEKRGLSAVKIDSREELYERIEENLKDIKQENWKIRPAPQIRKGSPLQDIKTKFQNLHISGGESNLHKG
ncbi:MAG: hypothetical protein PG981_000698 [Wolbachia endosymbiont of Ctenocephalides orientis wCori]|nr:MAG: hypothetical protein PG981_000698 [Wolbachia endosymbiont of Ctenocephalides orientis wCori]